MAKGSKLGEPKVSYSLQKVNDNVILVCFYAFYFYVFVFSLYQVGDLCLRCQYMVFIVVEPFFHQ